MKEQVKKRKIISLFAIAALICAVSFITLGANSEAKSSPLQKTLKTGIGKTEADDEAKTTASQNTLPNTEIMFRQGSSLAMLDGEIVSIDGNNLNVIVFSRGEIYLLIRFITEAFGGSITTNSRVSYTVSLAGNDYLLTVDKNEIELDGKTIKINAPILLENSRLFAPISAVSEILGMDLFAERGLIAIGAEPEDSEIDGYLAQLSVLKTFSTHEELRSYKEEQTYDFYDQILKNDLDMGFSMGFSTDAELSFDSVSPTPAPEAIAGGAAASGPVARTDDYSQTNIQVSGVDEADIMRTDGKYIYALTSDNLHIIDAVANDMKILSSVGFKQSSPREMFVDGDTLILMLNSYGDFWGTTVMVFNIADRTNIDLLKEYTIEGDYLSARKIDANVYLVSRSHYWYYREYEPPFYIIDGTEREIPAPYINCFPGGGFESLTVFGFNLNDLDNPHISQYNGGGDTLYVSRDYMYIAQQSYGNAVINDFEGLWIAPAPPIFEFHNNTIIHKFALNDGESSYIGSGAVPGYLLNQFSMDEHQGNLRVATNANNANNVYILDKQLNIKSKIEGIAPGERIYSTRFMGNIGYMVTFLTVDPLFVIDLNPDNPKILGELKIPGYSDYLHPYDENTLIGFGKDATEDRGIALQQGVKIALFDVSDLANPTELHSVIIGGRGTDTSVLHDHKALLFNKDKNLLSFPISLYEGGDGKWEYGKFVFTGAFVYDISLDKGFVKRGEITHMTEEELKSVGNSWYYERGKKSPDIMRVIYIGDNLFSLSDRGVSSHGIHDVENIGNIEF